MSVDMVVFTEHSCYEFDDAAMTVARFRVHPDATDLRDEGVKRHYVSATAPVVGRSMRIHYGTDQVRYSTPVVRVTYKGASVGG